MTQITRLTPEQETELPRFRQRYLDIACGGGRIDRPALEAALADAYALLGKPAPKLLIFDSPAACMIAIKLFKAAEEYQIGGQFREQLSRQLGSNLLVHLGEHLGDHLGDQLRDQLWDQLGWQLGGQIRGQLGEKVERQLREQLWGQIRGQIRGQLENGKIFNSNFLWGTHDLYWIAWVRFAQKIGALLQPDTAMRLDIMERIATQCEWWWPYEGIVIASQRPSFVHFDTERRLHCDTGPAVQYADGYALYAWRSVTVPELWVTDPASLTAKVALGEENIELRRVAIDKLGWPRILAELDACSIDRDDDPLIGELIEVTLPDLDTPARFLRYTCGTGREFASGVPPHINSALAAQAWLTGMEPNQFQLPSERT